MSVPYNVAFLVLLVYAQRQSSNAQLTAVRLNASLWNGVGYPTAQFDGVDSVYIIGGIGSRDEILKYSISSDETTVVAQIPPVGVYAATSATDLNGNVYCIAGGDNNRNIYRFSPYNNSVVQLSAQLPDRNRWSAAVVDGRTNVSFIFGGDDHEAIVQFNMSSLTVERVGSLPPRWGSIAAVSDNAGSAFIFGQVYSDNNGQLQSVYKVNLTTFETTPYGPATFPSLISQPTSVWDGRHAYVIGGYGNVSAGIRSDSIIKFDPESMKTSILPVINFPGEGLDVLGGSSAVYVPALDRIYLFGGHLPNSGYQSGIWYIELSPIPTEQPITTEMPTMEPSPTTESTPSTTINPEIFSCVDRQNGMYSHPFDCAKFINCHFEVLTVFTCPPPLLFDVGVRTCTLPHLVSCDLSCDGKPDGVYPHPNDCSLFIGCDSEELQVYKCPPPLLFDSIGRLCDIPENAHCQFTSK